MEQYGEELEARGPHASDGVATIDALVGWLRSKGGVVDGCHVASAGSAGFRLVASRDLPAGHVLISIPTSCALSTDACLRLPFGCKMEEMFRLTVPENEETRLKTKNSRKRPRSSLRPALTKRSALYAALMAVPNADSEFGPLLRDLQTCAVSTPFLWADGAEGVSSSAALEEAWQDLPDTVAFELRGYYEHLHQEYSKLFPKLCKDFPEMFPKASCSEFSWFRAHSIYTSRALPYSPERPQPDEVLLPIVDRLNHDSNADFVNVQWRGVGLESGRGAVTLRETKAGEELILSYGCKGNVELAIGYGFAVWGNPHEVARIRIDLDELVDPDAPERAAADKVFADITSDTIVRLHCRAEGPSSIIYLLRSEDVEESSSDNGSWNVLRSLCDKLAAVIRATGTDLLQDLLTRVSEEILADTELQGSENQNWTDLVKSAKAADSVQTGSSTCAVTVPGITTAIRHAQLTVLSRAISIATV